MDGAPAAEAPAIAKDKKTGLPLIECKQAASPQDEMTPDAWPTSSWPRKRVGVMPLADSNIWLRGAFQTCVSCRRATWLAGRTPREALFCRATQQSFLRLLTTSAVSAPYGIPPLSNKTAWSVYEGFLADAASPGWRSRAVWSGTGRGWPWDPRPHPNSGWTPISRRSPWRADMTGDDGQGVQAIQGSRSSPIVEKLKPPAKRYFEAPHVPFTRSP